MNILESFDITPNTNLLDVLGHSGYSLEAAVADIIDNSITARAKNIWINMVFDNENSGISIVDDGFGMSLEKLKQASTIAFKDMSEERDKNDLGRFSTGINSASASVCNKLIIQSKTKKYTEVNTIELDYLRMKTDGWVCNVISHDECYIKGNSGTAIVWQDLKNVASISSRRDFYNKISSLETHLAHVFGDYINEGLMIHINDDNRCVEAWDPFYKSHDKTTLIYNQPFEYHNSKIKAKIYILPPYNNLNSMEQSNMRGRGLNEQQGFYIYRHNRLIKEGGWLGLDDLSTSNKYDYARIRIDIETALDKYFDPNFLKNEIFIPDDLKEQFKEIAMRARRESRKSFNYMKAPSIARGVKKEKQIPVWNFKNASDGIILNINEEHPIVKHLVSGLSTVDKNRLFKLLAKNIPIGEITRNGVSKKQNTYPNIEQELSDMYERLKEDGLSNAEIMKQMGSCEPFCLSDDYISTLIDFFEKMGAI